MKLLLLCQIDKIPAFLQVGCRRNFDGYMLAVLESILGNGNMMDPVGSNIDQIDIVALTQLFIAVGTIIDVGFGQTGFLQSALLRFGTAFLIVAQSNDTHAVDVCPAFYCTGTAHTQSHKSHTYDRKRRSCQVQGALLPSRTLGNVNHDCTFVPMPLGFGSGCLKSKRSDHCHQQK